ncbi:cell division protein ZapA [Alphaproteobacteria bacterium]|nr:cell division protein ZapA [Alphaproteobacteria bacterium]
MPVVNVQINNGIFPIVCDEGQESRLSQLAERVDFKISSLKENLGQVDEKTILVMVAIIISDELDSIKKEFQSLKENFDKQKLSEEEKLANLYLNVSRDILNIADKLYK